MASKEYSSEGITVRFDPERCIHSEKCVKGLPQVFDVNKRPWIQPENAGADSVAQTVRDCPTGALFYELSATSRTQEPPPDENEISVGRDGPLYVRGSIILFDPDGNATRETRVALCRCGASSNKPFCDNSHLDSGFVHDGSLGEDRVKEDPEPPEDLHLSPAPDGPVLLRGKVRISDDPGKTAYTGSRTTLCRCGRSSNKPFCDGTHSKVGWKSD